MPTLTIGTCLCGRRGTLINGCCGWCEQDAPTAPTAAPSPVTRAITLMIAELADECPDPLAQRLTLATVAAHLCRLAGEPVPVAVLAALDGPPLVPVRVLVPDPLRQVPRRRGSFRDWSREFHDEPA